MGRIRSGLGDAVVGKRLDHLEELCNLMKDPHTSVKQLNTLYALRTAWQSRGYLLERELLIIRTTSTGEYVSRADQRAGKLAGSAAISTLPSETQTDGDGLSIGLGVENDSEGNVEIPEAVVESKKGRDGRNK